MKQIKKFKHLKVFKDPSLTINLSAVVTLFVLLNFWTPVIASNTCADIFKGSQFELLKAAAKNGEAVSDSIQNSTPKLTNLELFELAKIEATNRKSFSKGFHIENYQGLTKLQIFEIIKIVITRGNPGLISIYTKLLSKNQIFELAEISATVEPEMTSYFIRDFKLTNAQVFEVAKIAAAHSKTSEEGPLTYDHTDKYEGLLTNDQLFEYGKIAAARNGLRTSEFADDYKNLTDAQLTALAKIAIDNNKDLTNAIIRKFGAKIDTTKNPKFLRFLRSASPFLAFDSDLPDIQSIADLKKYFLSLKNSGLNSILIREYPQIIHMAWDKIQKRDTGLALIREAMRLIMYKRSLPKTSFELLAQASGLKLSLLPANISNDTLGKIYELILQIQENIYGPFFGKVKIPESIYKSPSELINLLTLIRDLKSIRGNDKQAAIYVLGFLRNINDLASITDLLKKNRVETVQELLNAKDVQLSYNDLSNLEMAWGDLKPVFTLIARFNGNPNWKPLISELSKVFLASLRNEFLEFKFEGDRSDPLDMQKARAQLSSLSKKGLKEWKKQRAMVSIAKDNKGLSEQEVQDAVLDIFRNNLLVHLKSDSKPDKDLQGLNDFIIEQRLSPKEILPLILEKYSLDITQESLNKNILTNILNQFHSSKLSHFSKLISFINFLLKQDPLLVEINQKEQVDQDLRSMRDMASSYKDQTQSASQPGLILTVLNSDPKFLLTIGDLVNTASCQSYRTGSHIETLLGYVIDANVQALVTFSITENNFQSQKDFLKIQRAYENKQEVHVEFDGNKVMAIFKLSNGEVISTKNLGYAYLRQVVKQGVNVNTKKSALFLEREYRQNHPYILQMREQQKEMFIEILEATDSTSEGPIKIFASRNQGGQYSDAVSGVQKESYIVNPEK